MPSRSLTKSAMAVLGCAGAAVAAPVMVSYLATLSIPFFGAMLAGVITNEKLREKLVEAIGNMAAGFMTEIGGHFATNKIPSALSRDHNFHLERMLATAYLNSLEAIEKEFKAGEDEKLKEQAAQILSLLKARIERGLKERDLSALFPLQTAGQPADTAFANRFSAENVTLLMADEEKWHEQLGEEVETALRRWLDQEREAEDRAARITQLSLARDARLPSLCARACARSCRTGSRIRSANSSNTTISKSLGLPFKGHTCKASGASSRESRPRRRTSERASPRWRNASKTSPTGTSLSPRSPKSYRSF